MFNCGNGNGCNIFEKIGSKVIIVLLSSFLLFPSCRKMKPEVGNLILKDSTKLDGTEVKLDTLTLDSNVVKK